MKLLCVTFAVLTLSMSIYASDVPSEYLRLAEDAVIEVYSRGWDDDRFSMSKSDIWGMGLVENDFANCVAVVTGYAKKPGYYGPSTYSRPSEDRTLEHNL